MLVMVMSVLLLVNVAVVCMCIRNLLHWLGSSLACWLADWLCGWVTGGRGGAARCCAPKRRSRGYTRKLADGLLADGVAG